MSLSLLLDEHISAAVATQVAAKRPEVSIQNIYDWRGDSGCVSEGKAGSGRPWSSASAQVLQA
jgi:hypothetical protein